MILTHFSTTLTKYQRGEEDVKIVIDVHMHRTGSTNIPYSSTNSPRTKHVYAYTAQFSLRLATTSARVEIPCLLVI